MRGDDIRYNRFLMRLFIKHPEHIILTVMNGHACLASGSYKYALGLYSLFKLLPTQFSLKYSIFL